ncbi:MAG: hypothetical protein ACRDD1_04360 [Planctomycetia bacterium]
MEAVAARDAETLRVFERSFNPIIAELVEHVRSTSRLIGDVDELAVATQTIITKVSLLLELIFSHITNQLEEYGDGVPFSPDFHRVTNTSLAAMIDGIERFDKVFDFLEEHGRSISGLTELRDRVAQARAWISAEYVSEMTNDTLWSESTSLVKRTKILQLRRLASFAGLMQGWDGYKAAPPSLVAFRSAQQYLNSLEKSDLLPDDVDPSVVGGVGFTYHHGDRSVYLEFRNTGTVNALFMNGRNSPSVTRVEPDGVGYDEFVKAARSHLE